MKVRIKVVHVPIYDFKLVIIDTKKVKYVNKFVEDKDCHLPDNTQDDFLGYSIFSTYKNHRAVFLIVNSKDKEFDDSIIVHETVHCVNAIFQEIHHTPDTENDEPQAYLTHWIFKHAQKFIHAKD